MLKTIRYHVVLDNDPRLPKIQIDEPTRRRAPDGGRQSRRESSSRDPEEDPRQARTRPGDYLEVEVERGKVVMTPRTLVDRQLEKRLAEGLEDFRVGRSHGPFDSAKEAVR